MRQSTRRGLLAALAGLGAGAAGCSGRGRGRDPVTVTPAPVPTDGTRADRDGDGAASTFEVTLPQIEDPRPVTERHATAALDHARRLLARAGRLLGAWPTGHHTDLRATVDTAVSTGRRRLSKPRPATVATLDLAAAYVRRGGFAVGAARAATDRLDGREIPSLAATRRRREALDVNYSCEDPEWFLVAVGAAERRLDRCRRVAAAAPPLPSDADRLRAAGRALAARAVADRACEDARRLLGAFRARAGERRPFGTALVRNRDELTRDIEASGATLERPGRAVSRVRGALETFGGPAPDPGTARRLDERGYVAAGVVHAARVLVRLRGAERALERAGTDDPGQFGSPRPPPVSPPPEQVRAERATTVGRLRAALGATTDDPLARLLLRDARETVDDADLAVREGDAGEHESAPPVWGYRLARGMIDTAQRVTAVAAGREPTRRRPGRGDPADR